MDKPNKQQWLDMALMAPEVEAWNWHWEGVIPESNYEIIPIQLIPVKFKVFTCT